MRPSATLPWGYRTESDRPAADAERGPTMGADVEAAAPAASVRDLETEPTMQGRCIGPYRVLRPLVGAKGMGDLWEGVHLDTHRAVAIELLKPGIESPEFQRRFFREGHALSAVRHPNLVEVLDVFPFDDRSPAIVMELVSGETLADKLARDKVLAVGEVARIMLPVVSAVGTAHALGFAHTALEPGNIFLARAEDAEKVKVLELGIAKVREGRTASGAVRGASPYMSPEQVYREEDIDHRTDIWSLGLILYQCLSGVLPTGAGDADKRLGLPLWPLDRVRPGLPEELTSLVDRMLSRRPDLRPGDLGEVMSVLGRYTTEHAPPFGPPAVAAKNAQRAGVGRAVRVFQVGDAFGEHFEITKVLHAGRETSVYEVLHGATGRRRALKLRYGVPVTSRADRARLRREATLTAGVHSEHLVDVFDVGTDPVNRAPFVIMELLAGERSTAWIDRQAQRRGDATDVVALATQAATLLDRTHAAGIVHGDIRPENVFVTRRDDGSLRMKLLNFVVPDAAHEPPRPVRPFSPPLFLAPEQLDGLPPDPRTDLYALAHVVYAMLVGTPYWDDEATTARSLEEIVTRIRMGAKEAPTVRASRRGVTLLPAFDDWFFRATAPEPHRRFDGGQDLARALAASLGLAQDGSVRVLEEVPRARRATRARTVRRATSIALVAAGLTAAFALGWAIRPSFESTSALLMAPLEGRMAEISLPEAAPPATAPTGAPSAKPIDTPPPAKPPRPTPARVEPKVHQPDDPYDSAARAAKTASKT